MAHKPLVYWSRDREHWAVTQEQERHNQVLWEYGELAIFALLWHLEDFTAGLVGRCQTCYLGETSVQARISEAYGQGDQYKCKDCFGTTFEGGYKAIIVRPTLFSDTDKDQKTHSRGLVNADEVDIESTADFRIRTGDYCIRATGDRFFLRVPQRVTLRTGFGVPWQSTAAVTYSHARAVIEDPEDVSYIIPPDNDRARDILVAVARYPLNRSQYEDIRAPLIPEDVPPADIEPDEDDMSIIQVQGPEGPAGPAGPTGSTGTSGGSYEYSQGSPAATWSIAHDLGYRPAGVRVIDSAGNDVEGVVSYPDDDRVTITFGGPFSGTAYLS
jgi:hypothetical protein